MPHLFGELLRQYRARKPGLTQGRLADAAGYDPAIVARMAQGKKDLTGPSGRERVVRIIEVLRDEGALRTLAEANALLAAAEQPPLYEGLPAERALVQSLRPELPRKRRARSSALRFAPPAPLTGLIGREREVDELVEMLSPLSREAGEGLGVRAARGW